MDSVIRQVNHVSHLLSVNGETRSVGSYLCLSSTLVLREVYHWSTGVLVVNCIEEPHNTVCYPENSDVWMFNCGCNTKHNERDGFSCRKRGWRKGARKQGCVG